MGLRNRIKPWILDAMMRQMDPLRGDTIDGRADLYSLGAIMYEIFTQQSVFQGKSFGDYVRMHLNDTPVRPSETPGGKDIDEGIEAVIMRCLEKSPDARFQTAQDLRAELLTLLAAIETTGELTDHLRGGAPAASPSGDARPKDYDSRPASQPLGTGLAELSASQRGEGYAPGGSSQEIGRMPVVTPYDPNAGSPSGPQPMLNTPYDPNAGSPSGPQPMHGYGIDSQDFALSGQMGQTPMLAGYAHHAQRKKKNAMMLAGGITVVAIIALLVVSGGSDSGEDTGAAGGVAEIEDPEEVVKPEEVVNPEEPTNTRFVNVLVQSEPPGALFAVGTKTPVCKKTPCELRIDTADGGSPDTRDFVVRLDGYEDKDVEVGAIIWVRFHDME